MGSNRAVEPVAPAVGHAGATAAGTAPGSTTRAQIRRMIRPSALFSGMMKPNFLSTSRPGPEMT